MNSNSIVYSVMAVFFLCLVNVTHDALSAEIETTYTDGTSVDESGCDYWNTSDFWRTLTINKLEECLRQGVDPNVRGEHGFTPLHWATHYTENPVVIKTLVDAGADPNALDKYGLSPLYWATSFDAPKTPAVIMALLDVGGYLNVRNGDGSTPLHQAAYEIKSPAVIKAMIDAGADPNERDFSGCTPLHSALGGEDNTVAFNVLMEAGADPNAQCNSGKTPLHWADDLTAIKILLEAGADPNARDVVGETRLHGGGVSAQVKVLVEAGADPNARDVYGETPLHKAAFNYENPSIIKALVQVGADPNARDEDGYTPLHMAGAINHFDPYLFDSDIPHRNRAMPIIIKALAEVGADPNARDENGGTPLHWAALYTEIPVVIKTLVDAGADPNTRDEDGETPLHKAASRNENPAVIKVLVEAGADPNARDVNGDTPLHRAVESIYISITVIQALMDVGADLNTYNRYGMGPLATAVDNNANAEVVASLLKAYLPDGVINDQLSLTQRGLHKSTCWFKHDINWPNKECFFMVVNEKPDDELSSPIAFPVVRFVTSGSIPKSNPILHLGGGGPGSSMELEQNPHYHVWDQYKDLVGSSGRDLYVIDPRGVGMGHPSLRCTGIHHALKSALAETLTLKEEQERLLTSYRGCKEFLDREGYNLSYYDSATVARDVELLRRALGVNQWVLFGGSYGSRYALTVARDFPDSVEAMILQSAAFPNLRYTDLFAEMLDRAFETVFTWCGNVGTCDTDLLRNRFWNLVHALDETPLVLDEFPMDQKFTDQLKLVTVGFHLTGRRLVEVIFAALYDGDFFSAFPDLVDELERGKTRVLEDAVATYLSLYLDNSFNDPVWYSHYCGEEYPFVDFDLARRNAQAATDYVGDLTNIYLSSYQSICQLWDVIAAGPVEGEPVKTSIPTLFLQGALDPVTPNYYLNDQLRYFDHYEVLVFDDSSHWGSIGGACAMEAAGYFIEYKHLEDKYVQCAKSEKRLEKSLDYLTTTAEME